MEIYAVLGFDTTPKKLRRVGDSAEFYCYFPPPLPEILVIFATKCDQIALKNALVAQLCLDTDTDSVSRIVGELSVERNAICFDGSWDQEQKLLADEIQDKGRLIKLIISPKCQSGYEDTTAFSQDSGILEPLPSNIDNEFESEYKSDLENCSVTSDNSNFNQNKDGNITTPLVDVKQVPRRGTSLKRKSIFDFEEEDDCQKEIITEDQFCKNPSEKQRKGKHRSGDAFKDKSNSPELNKIRTPKSKKLWSRNNLTVSSPITPGVTELEAPTPRWGHTFCKAENDDKAFLIGGQGLKHHMCKDSIWQYTISSRTWTRTSDNSNGASRRMGHTATYCESSRKIYIFGGSKNKKWYSDVHELDVDSLKWSNITVTGKAPIRSYHSCTLSNEELIVFGGVFPNPDPVPDGCSNDVYIFNTVSSSWYQPIVSGEKPHARSGHSANLINGQLFIFGGWDAPECFNDLWTLDIGLMNFKRMNAVGQAPSPRSWHGAEFIADTQSIFIHGGYNGDSALSDSYLLRIASMTWTRLVTNNVYSRAGHQLLHVSSMGKMGRQEYKTLVFGGGNNEGEFYNDVADLGIHL